MLAAVPLLAVGVVDGAAVLGRQSAGHPQSSASPTPHVAQTSAGDRRSAALAAAAARAAAVRALLARRSQAVMTHDRAEWRSVLDPHHRGFLRQQMRVFDNLQRVPFASWTYGFNRTRTTAPSSRSTRYHAPTWSPADFTLDYRLRGFDKRATSLPQYPTFVHRGTSWYLTSFNDFKARGQRSSTDLWDYGPVVAVRTPRVLVLGHPQALPLMQGIAAQVAGDIPRVSAVWTHHWSERAVVLVPSTQRELGRVVDDYGDLDKIAAVATAEVQLGSSRPDPVGDRIGINPANWPKLSLLGQRIVLTHELTHVATRAVTSTSIPTWLAEGFADYVGYLGSGVPTTFVAQDLAAAVRAGHQPRQLPQTGQFNGASAKLSNAYEGAWLACRLIADRWGQSALVRLYSSVGHSRLGQARAVDVAMQRVLHIPASTFVERWRSFVSQSLG